MRFILPKRSAQEILEVAITHYIIVLRTWQATRKVDKTNLQQRTETELDNIDVRKVGIFPEAIIVAQYKKRHCGEYIYLQT